MENKHRRQVKTFGTKVKYNLRDGRWIADATERKSIDQLVNEWVDQTNNIILSISTDFNDKMLDAVTMTTDYVYVVVYMSYDDYVAQLPQPAAATTQEPTSAAEPTRAAQPPPARSAPAQPVRPQGRREWQPEQVYDARNKVPEGCSNFAGLDAEVPRG